jgi:transcriptional regulator of NAD metabolism
MKGGTKLMEVKKLLGEERRGLILSHLKETAQPVTGGELAKMANVSRQVIVGDITLLKARLEPIIATSQGYLYMSPTSHDKSFEKIFACQHTPDKTEEELNLLVDCGVTVKDVRVEHPVYGDLTASIMVSNRYEVKQFLLKINETSAAFLSELTDGIHMHTVSATNNQALIEAEKALCRVGILIETN